MASSMHCLPHRVLPCFHRTPRAQTSSHSTRIRRLSRTINPACTRQHLTRRSGRAIVPPRTTKSPRLLHDRCFSMASVSFSLSYDTTLQVSNSSSFSHAATVDYWCFHHLPRPQILPRRPHRCRRPANRRGARRRSPSHPSSRAQMGVAFPIRNRLPPPDHPDRCRHVPWCHPQMDWCPFMSAVRLSSVEDSNIVGTCTFSSPPSRIVFSWTLLLRSLLTPTQMPRLATLILAPWSSHIIIVPHLCFSFLFFGWVGPCFLPCATLHQLSVLSLLYSLILACYHTV